MGQVSAPKKHQARSHHWGSPSPRERVPLGPVIGQLTWTVFGPCIDAVSIAAECARGIRRAAEDPCCSSFAHLPYHLGWMSDASGSRLFERDRPRSILHCPIWQLSLCRPLLFWWPVRTSISVLTISFVHWSRSIQCLFVFAFRLPPTPRRSCFPGSIPVVPPWFPSWNRWDETIEGTAAIDPPWIGHTTDVMRALGSAVYRSAPRPPANHLRTLRSPR